MLDVQAFDTCFKRFDVFNNKYNPMGEPMLREVFLKTDNFIQGSFLADLTRQMFKDLEKDVYTFTEYRISIYGKNKNEWIKLAKWIIDNNLSSHQNRWMI